MKIDWWFPTMVILLLLIGIGITAGSREDNKRVWTLLAKYHCTLIERTPKQASFLCENGVKLSFRGIPISKLEAFMPNTSNAPFAQP